MKHIFNKYSNKAFTLIELLAVIIILAIILVIAVPQILKKISITKDNLYNSQVELIVNAAIKYNVTDTVRSFIMEQKVITLKELQDGGYIKDNIKDPRTGEYIPDNSWVVITNDNGEYKYDFGYASNNLVLHYDGIYNGGIGIHNDNTSANKSVWTDLSGNNKNGTLYNFDYNSVSGWSNNSLLVGKAADSFSTSNPLSYQTLNLQKYTVELLVKIPASILSTDAPYLYGINSGLYLVNAANKALHYINGGVNDYYCYSSDVTPRDVFVYLTYRFNKDSSSNIMKVEIFKNGVDFSYPNFPNNQNKTPSGMNSNIAFNLKNMEVFSVKIYDRVLTNEEIIHNYNIEKLRYKI